MNNKTYPELVAEGIKRTVFSEARNKRFAIMTYTSQLVGNASLSNYTDIEKENTKLFEEKDLKKLMNIFDKLLKEYQSLYDDYDDPGVGKKPDLNDEEFRDFLSFNLGIDLDDDEEMEELDLDDAWSNYTDNLRKDCCMAIAVYDTQENQLFTAFSGTERPRVWGLLERGNEFYDELKSIGAGDLFNRLDVNDYHAEPKKSAKTIESAMKKSWISKVK